MQAHWIAGGTVTWQNTRAYCVPYPSESTWDHCLNTKYDWKNKLMKAFRKEADPLQIVALQNTEPMEFIILDVLG